MSHNERTSLSKLSKASLIYIIEMQHHKIKELKEENDKARANKAD